MLPNLRSQFLSTEDDTSKCTTGNFLLPFIRDYRWKVEISEMNETIHAADSARPTHRPTGMI